MIRILVVDDELYLRDALRDLLGQGGFEVHDAPSGRVAFDLLQKDKYDLVITDIRMPDGDGLEFIAQIRAQKLDDLRVYVMTGFDDMSYPRSDQLNVKRVFSKPYKVAELLNAIFEDFQNIE